MTRVSVNQGRRKFLWRRSTPIIVGCWFGDRTWKNKEWWSSPAGLCLWVADPCRKQTCTL